MSVLGIHHVTAISGHISGNLEFYTGVLGLRLVKKSINQDDVKAYHLFYADAMASPGTDLTFFDWPKIHPNQPGPGSVALISLRISRSSLDFWETRLREAGALVERDENHILLADPEGQRLAMLVDDGLPGQFEPWSACVPAEHATRGFYGIEIDSMRPEGTSAVLKSLLGFEEVAPGYFELKTEESFAQVVMGRSMSNQRGYPGAGGVHHVAFRAKDDDHMKQLQEKIEKFGLQTSGYVDRYYFHSLYFREPGGVLFEIATDGPGMHMDEEMDHLGEKLSIPPFLEGQREAIEAGLKPLPDPAYMSKK